MKKWSQQVSEHSKALVLPEGIFTWKNPKEIASSLKHSADTSKNKKGTSLQSAMSMLNFYINRAGKKLSAERKKILEKAKIELRKLYEQ
jgi:hypothetical protein